MMNNIAIFTLTSELHDEQAVSAVTREFLDSLHVDYDLMGADYTSYGQHTLDLIYVRTGGTEGIFRRLLPQLQQQSSRPFYLLTSGKSNSLAASMEILSYLLQNGYKGEIIHGTADYISARIRLLAKVEAAKEQMSNCRLGIVGQPSDWLISSHANEAMVKEKLGIDLIPVPMQELMDIIKVTPEEGISLPTSSPAIQQALPGAEQIYQSLKTLVSQNNLQGFTLRCFDLLTAVRNTGCMALARLGAEGFTAGCEGDVPAMLSMAIVRMLLGTSCFQSNPASINPSTGELLMAHCTIPLDLVSRYELDTHFESGIGVGIRGYAEAGGVTLFKVSGDLSECFAAEATLTQCTAAPNLCRTQFHLRLDHPADANYFLTRPIGNHHVVLPGRHAAELLQFCEALQR